MIKCPSSYFSSCCDKTCDGRVLKEEGILLSLSLRVPFAALGRSCSEHERQLVGHSFHSEEADRINPLI